MLVHEPEAAALTVLKEVQGPIATSEDDTFMVVDAGSGTVDITCHVVSAVKLHAAVTCQMLLMSLLVHVLSAVSILNCICMFTA